MESNTGQTKINHTLRLHRFLQEMSYGQSGVQLRVFLLNIFRRTAEPYAVSPSGSMEITATMGYYEHLTSFLGLIRKVEKDVEAESFDYLQPQVTGLYNVIERYSNSPNASADGFVTELRAGNYAMVFFMASKLFVERGYETHTGEGLDALIEEIKRIEEAVSSGGYAPEFVTVMKKLLALLEQSISGYANFGAEYFYQTYNKFLYELRIEKSEIEANLSVNGSSIWNDLLGVVEGFSKTVKGIKDIGYLAEVLRHGTLLIGQ